MLFDLASAGVQLFAWWRGAKQLKAWLSLLASMVFSGVIAFLSGMGSALVAGKSFLVSFGWGELAAAGVLLALFVRSPLTRGLLIVVPAEASKALEELDTNTIERS